MFSCSKDYPLIKSRTHGAARGVQNSSDVYGAYIYNMVHMAPSSSRVRARFTFTTKASRACKYTATNIVYCMRFESRLCTCECAQNQTRRDARGEMIGTVFAF